MLLGPTSQRRRRCRPGAPGAARAGPRWSPSAARRARAAGRAEPILARCLEACVISRPALFSRRPRRRPHRLGGRWGRCGGWSQLHRRTGVRLHRSRGPDRTGGERSGRGRTRHGSEDPTSARSAPPAGGLAPCGSRSPLDEQWPMESASAVYHPPLSSEVRWSVHFRPPLGSRGVADVAASWATTDGGVFGTRFAEPGQTRALHGARVVAVRSAMGTPRRRSDLDRGHLPRHPGGREVGLDLDP